MPIFAQSTADDTLALQFYPAALDADFVADHEPNTPIYRSQTNMRFDFDFTGLHDYLAVAYSNGMSARLRLIKTSGPAPLLVAESTDSAMGGRGLPLMDGYDIDADGTPEVVVTLLKSTWIYRYTTQGTSHTLVQVEPTINTPQGPTSALGQVLFMDVDGDCSLEMMEYAPHDSDTAYVYYRLNGPAFQQYPDVKVAFADTFTADDNGQISSDQRHFDVAVPGAYNILISPMCGGDTISILGHSAGPKATGSHPMKPGSLAPPSGGGGNGLYLNGLKIIDEASLVAGASINSSQWVTLQGTGNVLSLTLSSSPGATYAVTVMK